MQQGREPLDVDFCSITIDGSLDNDLLQRRLRDVARQREEMQNMEIELRAQILARSELIEVQNSFDAQIKEHANAASKLQVSVDLFPFNGILEISELNCEELLFLQEIYILSNLINII